MNALDRYVTLNEYYGDNPPEGLPDGAGGWYGIPIMEAATYYGELGDQLGIDDLRCRCFAPKKPAVYLFLNPNCEVHSASD